VTPHDLSSSGEVGAIPLSRGRQYQILLQLDYVAVGIGDVSVWKFSAVLAA
jgi:hypothetical protein